MNTPTTFQEIADRALQLPAVDKVRLIERLASGLEQDIQAQALRPRRSLYGLCADLGLAPTAEEIDQAREEAWANFPHEDIT